MTTHAPNLALWPVIAVACLGGAVASRAAAGVATDRGASLVEFAKVISDGIHDTAIELTNMSNLPVSVKCFYVNSLGRCSFSNTSCETDFQCPSGQTCINTCSELDFVIRLTPQQPTVWLVSQGRPVDPTEPPCNATGDCYGRGLDPGFAIPSVAVSQGNFRGELLCVQVDESEVPIAGNALAGVATLKHLSSGDSAKYNAVGLAAAAVDSDLTLELGTEYDACPESWILNHRAEGAEDVLVGTGSTMNTRLTVVPCARNYDTQTPGTSFVFFEVTNEFESRLSAATVVQCWRDLRLPDVSPVFNLALIGTDFVQTRIMATPMSPSAFMVVAQELHQEITGPTVITASAATSPHTEGVRPGDEIVLIDPPSGP